MNNHIEQIKSGATTAFIDSTNKSNLAYKQTSYQMIIQREKRYSHLLRKSLRNVTPLHLVLLLLRSVE